MKKNFLTTIGPAILFVIAAFTAGGCSSLSGKMSLPTFAETSSPSQIVAVWDPVVRHEDGKVYRGLCARIIFYDSSSKKALRVKGDFDIYVFDEDDKEKKKDMPSKVVRYKAADLKHLESDSKLLGKSYTVWVPWDEVTDDSKKKKLSLFVRFTSTDGTGTMVVSHQATVDLPGSNPDETLEPTVYANPYLEDQKMYMAKLEMSSKERQANMGTQELEEWKNTVAEYMITKENRPQAMLTTTINMPGVSRDGPSSITPERRYASVTDEQKRQAQALLANAGIVQPNRPMQQTQAQPLQTQQPLQNAVFASDPNAMGTQPINQVQFQSPQPHELQWQQWPATQPAEQTTDNPANRISGNFAAANYGTTWR